MGRLEKNMSDHDKITYWVELADYDFETAKALLDSKRYLYVGFMRHQVVEKMLKAVYVSIFNEIPPKTHDLRHLATKIGIYAELSEDMSDTLALLNPMNIDSRYPDYQRKIASTLNQKQCKELISLTEELNNWIRQKLSKGSGNTPS